MMDVEFGEQPTTRVEQLEFVNPDAPSARVEKNETGRAEQERAKDQGDPSVKVFSIYVAKAEEHDKTLIESWNADMDGILIFAGLFSAVVTAFIIESYKGLQPDSGEKTLVVLGIISQQLGAMSNSSLPSVPLPPPDQLPFQPISSTVRVNAYWFLSLAFSLTCALIATLVKQWGRRFLQEVSRHPAAYKRARIRSFLFQGLQSFKMPVLVDAVPTLLHISLALFLIGLVEFLYPINHLLAYILLSFLVFGALLYGSTILLPSFYLHCPYQTPSSHLWWHTRLFWRPVLRLLWKPVLLFIRLPWCQAAGHTVVRLVWRLRHVMNMRPEMWVGDLANAREISAMTASRGRTRRDDWALQWTVEQLDEDHELEPFIQGLPDFVKSTKVENGPKRLHRLLGYGLGGRIFRTLQSCNVNGILDVSQQQRYMTCLDVIQLSAPWFSRWLFCKEVMLLLVDLSATSGSPIATRAKCTTTVVADHFLRDVLELLSQRRTFDTADQIRAVGQINALGSLPIMQPLQPLLQEAGKQGYEFAALLHIRRHLSDIRIVLLVHVISDYLRKHSEHLWHRALLDILKQWTEVAPGLAEYWTPSLHSLIIELESTLSHDSQQHPTSIQNLLTIVNRITWRPRIHIWQRMARNILEGRDANDGIEPLPVPLDRNDLGELQWVMDQFNKDRELVPFIQGLPDVPSLMVDDGQRRLLNLFRNGIGDPIFRTLQSCSDNDGIVDALQQQRCIACMEFVWLSARWFAACRFSNELRDLLVDLTTTDNTTIATYARCIIVILTWEALSAVIARPSLPAHWEQEPATIARGRLLMGLQIMLPLRPMLSSLTGNEVSLNHDQILRWIRPHLREVRLVLLLQVVIYYLRNPSETVQFRALFDILKQWIDENMLKQTESLHFLLVELEITFTLHPQLPNHSQNVLDIVDRIVETLCIPTWKAMALNILQGRGLNVGIAPLPVPQGTQPSMPWSSVSFSQVNLNDAPKTALQDLPVEV